MNLLKQKHPRNIRQFRFYCSNKNIEIEVKFACNNEIEEKIRKISKFLKKREFEDIYWDRTKDLSFSNSNEKNTIAYYQYPLTTNDIWLRQRSGAWEIKIPFRFRNGISLTEKNPQIIDEYLEEVIIQKYSCFLFLFFLQLFCLLYVH